MSRTAKLARNNVEPDFNGAALIDDEGNEIAITEDMIRRAIHALDDDVYTEIAKKETRSESHKPQFAKN